MQKNHKINYEKAAKYNCDVCKYHRKSCVREVIPSKYVTSNDIGWY